MSTRLARAAFVALLRRSPCGCGNQQRPAPPSPVSASTPDATIRKSADLLKQGDLAGFMQNALPPADFAELKADWGKDDQGAPGHRRGSQEIPGNDGAPDCARCRKDDIRRDRAAAEAVRRAVPAADPDVRRDGLGLAAGHGAAEQGSFRRRQAAGVAAINALAAWVQKTRFTDPESVKKVLAIATRDRARSQSQDARRSACADVSMQSMQKAHVAILGLQGRARRIRIFGRSDARFGQARGRQQRRQGRDRQGRATRCSARR